MAKLVIDTKLKKEPLGDLYGIFYEDLNHAADGGLYGELVQNRSFEFSEIDHPSYHPLTGWEVVQSEGDRIKVSVQNAHPINTRNPHYLVIDVFETSCGSGVKNLGFNTGLPYEEGKNYLFSAHMASDGRPLQVQVTLEGEDGSIYGKKHLTIEEKEWKEYSCMLTSSQTDYSGRLVVRIMNEGRLYLDMVSLFPEHTYKMRANGMRADLAEFLADLKPKFMRFPGGCLVHDGSINSQDRDSMYRWKNTIGDISTRPSRRNNWNYNQTLGLGFYEYFIFCEDIGAKPLPVLPAGYDPHHHRLVPFDQLDEWIEDALDLIEFANGDTITTWGAIRAKLGHPEPFHLEYIAIGNEEVGDGFFDRYPYFHKAIKEKYPSIKIINSSGPFAHGSEYDKGWASAKENQSDYVDEHYYTSPEWLLANHHRYDSFKKEDPKVFLGEYATWGNTWYNALTEASFMIGLERNAHAVGLACYAPLLCNVDYINWQPNMIWFNNHQSFGTANYYVQKLFMNHQGDVGVSITGEDLPPVEMIEDMTGDEIRLGFTPHTITSYYDIKVINEDTGKVTKYKDCTISSIEDEVILANVKANRYRVIYKAKKLSGVRGFTLQFDRKDGQNKRNWELGGWQNQDCFVSEDLGGRNSVLTHRVFSVERNREYNLELLVDGDKIQTFVDGELMNEITKSKVCIESLYYAASLDETSKDIIIKVVNVSDKGREAEVCLHNLDKNHLSGTIYQMAGYTLDAKNSFDEPQLVSPKEESIYVEGNSLPYEFPKQSLTVFRFKNI